jgi:pyrroline-5-carboxylate reductase
MLGEAIARGWLASGMAPERILLMNRSGRCPALPELEVTTKAQVVQDRAEAILLCVPPAALGGLSLHVPDRLVLSVVAGATLDRLQALTGTSRVIRAMSSPAAALGLAYSPFVASAAVTAADRALATALLRAIGKTDEVTEEGHIDLFTALTGPVPGFVAAFAEAMAATARAEGVDAQVADRAIRQLIRASGEIFARDAMTPAEHVQEMIDYAGTTAAGLSALTASPFAECVAKAIRAATERARSISAPSD